jgi:hypothetical protein
MLKVERGKVRSGGIVFEEPLMLPEGTEVVVSIETLADEDEPTDATADEDFAALPFFGMWADREDMADSAAWVRQMREQWQQRAVRQD